jgi:hypothetical protein
LAQAGRCRLTTRERRNSAVAQGSAFAMRALILAAVALALSACGSICWDDHSGLSDPPLGSSAPKPNG